MINIRGLIDAISSKKFAIAESLIGEAMKEILASKLIEVKKMIAANRLSLDEASSPHAKIAKQLGLAPDNWSSNHSSWKKDGGHAGKNKLHTIENKAKKLGFVHKTSSDNSSPDGSVIGGGNVLHHPDGHELTLSSSYGATAHDNYYHASLKTEEVTQENIEEANTTKMGRIKLVKVRIRGGKVQRRKKLSAVKGYTIRKGSVVRMSSGERRRRKLGARRAKIKRRSKRSQSRLKLRRSLRKRKAMGL